MEFSTCATPEGRVGCGVFGRHGNGAGTSRQGRGLKLAVFALMAFVALVSFLCYRYTLCGGVYPGISAAVTASALGVLPQGTTGPVWLTFMRGIVALAGANPVSALNTVNALLSAAALAWLFFVVRRVLLVLIRIPPALRLVPVDDEDAESETDPKLAGFQVTLDEESEVSAHVASTLGALVVAFSFAFCAPFWRVSTSLHVEPLNLLLALVATDLLTRYLFEGGRLGMCVAASFMYGLLVFEWPVFLAFAPLLACVIVFGGIKHEQLSESFLLLTLLSWLGGICFSLGLMVVVSALAQDFSFTALSGQILSLLNSHFQRLAWGMPKRDWFFVVVLPALALGAAVKGCSMLTSREDEATRWKWRVINLLSMAVVCVNLLNLPKSIWRIAREGAHVPVLPALVVALAAGCLFVFWMLSLRDSPYGGDEERTFPGEHTGLRLLGYGLCGVLAVLVFRQPVINQQDADGRQAAFADSLAKEVLALSTSANCLVTDGVLDVNLLVAQKTGGMRLKILPLFSGGSGLVFSARGAGAASASQRGAPGEDSGTALRPFLTQWMRANPDSHGQLSFFCLVPFLQKQGFWMVPDGLTYVSRGPVDKPDELRAAFAKNRDVWQRLQAGFDGSGPSYPALRRTHVALRSYVSRLANDMGVCLEQAGLLAEADDSYALAQRFGRLNLTAALNQYGLRLRHAAIGSSGEIAERLMRVMAQPRFFENFDVMVEQGGVIVSQGADTLLPMAMAAGPVGALPPEKLLTLVERWMAQSHVRPAHPGLVSAAASRSPLDQALVARVAGQGKHSERLLRRLVNENPDDFSAWSLLAEQLLERGELAEVETRILPSMRLAQGSEKNPLLYMTEGALHLKAHPPRHIEARGCFRRVLALQPDLGVAGDQILRAALAIGDAQMVEADALAVVSSMPQHPLAHALLGSLRLSQKRHEEAERHLKASVEMRPTAGAYNDLAEVFRRQQKWADAEACARAAIRLEPGLYQAWDTLGMILQETSRLNEAETAFRCLTSMRPSDADGYLQLAELWGRQGRKAEALELLVASANKLTHMPPIVQDKIQKLRHELRD